MIALDIAAYPMHEYFSMAVHNYPPSTLVYLDVAYANTRLQTPGSCTDHPALPCVNHLQSCAD